MKNKKVILVIIILLLLILIGFAGVYAYITLDMFRTPKELFGKYLNNQIDQIENMNTGALKTIADNLKSTTSETEYEMSYEDTYGTASQVKFGIKNNPTNSQAMATLNMTSDETEIANYSLYVDKEKIEIKIPELHEKYFLISLDSALEEIQNYLINSSDSTSEKSISLSTEDIERYKNEFKTLYNNYVEDFKTIFTDERFSVEKNVEVSLGETTVTANKIIFTINSVDLSAKFEDMLNKFSDEQILTEFITEEQIKEFKTAIPDIASNMTLGDEVKICIYENSKTTIKTELLVDNVVVGELMVSNPSENITDTTIKLITIKEDETDVGQVETLVYSVEVQDQNTTKVTQTTSTTYNKDDVEALKKYYEENDYYYYSDEMVDEKYKDVTEVQTVTTTLNGQTATSKIKSDKLEDSGYENAKMQINYKFGTEISFDGIEDAINLDEYKDDQEKANELITTCMTNLQNNPNTLLGSLYLMFSGFESSELTDLNSGEDTYTSFDTISEDSEKTDLEQLVKDALNACLESYQRDLEEDPNTNVADYLTIAKISEMILSSSVSDLELIDGSTLKCKYYDEIYYIKLIINATTLQVDEVEAYTETEYQEL